MEAQVAAVLVREYKQERTMSVIRFLLALGLLLLGGVASGSGWSFVNADPSRAGGSLEQRGDAYILNGNFSRGGTYVAMAREFATPLNLALLKFEVRTAASRIAVRFTDAQGQTHQHFYPLSGDASVFQKVIVRAAGSAADSWGGAKDGVLRAPVSGIQIAVYRSDHAAGAAVTATIRNIDPVVADAGDAHGFVKAEKMDRSIRDWGFTNGREFPGAKGSREFVAPDTLRVNADFSEGGNYVAAIRNFSQPVEMNAIAFAVQTPSRGIDVRFTGADGQVHQHYVDLSGNPDEVQEVLVEAVSSPKRFWGGKGDGVLHQPIRSVALSVHGHLLPDKKGIVDYSNVRFLIPDYVQAGASGFAAHDPVSLLRESGDDRPVVLKMDMEPDSTDADTLMYYYTDYQGNLIGTGQGYFEKDAMTLWAGAPANTGFAELHFPALGIRAGVMTGLPAPAQPDEFFAVDSSFSWGAKVFSEAEMRAYCRILVNNGILWNRDRLRWTQIQPELGAVQDAGLFGLYRRVAAQEGVKTLDTFHDTPKWAGPFVNRDVYGPNPYPSKLKLAGEQWAEILTHYEPTVKALEVWNEPDIGFGSYFPADQVSSLTKAVSYAAQQKGLDTLIVGGVFAHPWPGTVLQDAYIANALLDTADVFSYHTYAGTLSMEPTVGGLRDRMLALGHERAGLPVWMTESGMPWYRGGDRAIAADDIISAAEIVGKAIEFKALGVEKYFAFEYKYYQEGEKNFGMMDANHTPMRSMGAYVHAAKKLANMEYIGDLEGTGAQRARVFTDGIDAVAVLYLDPRSTTLSRTFTLPKALANAEVTGIDGRLLRTEKGTVQNEDGIIYVTAPLRSVKNLVRSDTRAMKYYRLAHDFNRAARQSAPVVFRSSLDVSDMTFNAFGYNVRDFEDFTVDVSVQNLSDEPQRVRPALELPKGIRALDFSGDEVLVPAGGSADISFRLKIDPAVDSGLFRLVNLVDQNATALPLSFPFRAWEMETAPVARMDEASQDFSLAKLLAATDWIDFSSSERWHSWQGGEIEPNIEARFRAFYNDQTLQLQVLVKDEAFYQPYDAENGWRGDSLQIAFQQHDKKGQALNRRNWNEFTAAQTGRDFTLFGHRGEPRGLFRQSSLQVIPLGEGYWLYVVDVDAKELKLSTVAGSSIGFSLLVNSNSGSGRDGFLSWGSGIADSKDPSVFNRLLLK